MTAATNEEHRKSFDCKPRRPKFASLLPCTGLGWVLPSIRMSSIIAGVPAQAQLRHGIGIPPFIEQASLNMLGCAPSLYILDDRQVVLVFPSIHHLEA